MARHGRFDVFLSYARGDSGVASELDGWLRGQGFRTFFDRRELRPGLRWIPALEEAIGCSGAVAILIGRYGFGNTQQYERDLALVRQSHEATFPVIPVLMPGCENPPTGFLQLQTWIDLSQGDHVLQQQDSLEALRGAINRRPGLSSPIRGKICPYRGLEPFREEDSEFFCGRDDAIRDLIARVLTHSFVAVVGPSGSGKSSLSCGWRGVLIAGPQRPHGYPCHRGSTFQLGPHEALLWTQGNLPAVAKGKDYYKEGKGTPEPLLLVRHAGLGSIDDLCRETLALTKMDWNNDGPYDRLPVTLNFAGTLATIVKRMPKLQPHSYPVRLFM
jgi:TIR domain